MIKEPNTDLDSHTNQSLLGFNTLVIHNFDKPVNIVGYDPRGPVTHSLHMISWVLAYDCPNTGATFILIVHQAIHNAKLEHNLLSPFQMQLNDIIVNETPKFMTEMPLKKTMQLLLTTLIWLITWSFPLSCKVSHQHSQQGSRRLTNAIPAHALLWLMIVLSSNPKLNVLLI
jgi:hypothetical protein